MGAQRPTHLLTPEGSFDFSDGDDAIELAAALGLHLLDWQKWLVRWILAVDADGRPACNTVIVIVPRQNGKGAVLEAIELYWMIVAGIPVVVHTAHEADTAAGHQERLEMLIDEPPMPLPAIKSFKANGKERMRNLDERLLLQFRTRTKATKRGASPQRVVLDECQELQAAHLAALVPSMAAQSMNPEKMPQLIYTGSAPLEHSQYMHELLARVEKQRPGRTLLAMWACDADVDENDVENWYRVNPSLGVLISEEWVRSTEYLTMDRADFLAERLGVPKGGPSSTSGPIDPDLWAALTDGDSVIAEGDKSLRIGLDAPPDRTSATFAVAGKRDDNLLHVARRYHVPPNQMRDLVALAKELQDGHGGVPITVPSNSPALLAWRAELEAAGVALDVMTPADTAAAFGNMLVAIAEGTLRHRGQPEFNNAVSGLAVKKSGDVDVPARRNSSANIAPFIAGMCALYRVPEAREVVNDPFVVYA